MSFSFLRLLLAATLTTLITAGAIAQDHAAHDDIAVKPIYVTARIFQMKAKRGGYEEPTNQVFRMKTSSLSASEKWLSTLGKTYPGFEVALLKTEAKRVFRTSKPTTLSLIKQPDGRAIEAQLFGAQSPGDGTKPGTSLIPEIALHFGDDRTKKPVSYAIQPLEVESGMTYFFAVTTMKLIPSDY